MVRQNVRSRHNYVFNSLAKSPDLSNVLKESFWIKLTGQIRFSETGEALKREAEDSIHELDEKFAALADTDKEKAKKIVSKINGNIYLVAGVTPEILQKIDHEFSQQTHPHSSNDDWFDYFILWTVFDSYDTTYDSFDSESGGFGDGGDGGGDSGCSGCGGCGG